MWIDKIIKNLEGTQIINDSKTPSGRVHIGSLRGVLIHDAVLRELVKKNIPATFIYGVDDYDPMDGLPPEVASDFQPYMGHPLCMIPAPEGSQATDLADHYIQEFLGIFSELKVDAKVYRMRDVYRSGQFNESIDTILSQASVVREIYLKVSNSVRSDHWHPFQVVCEKCGKIGTTVVSDYDGKEVTYHCQPDLVQWAQGCDYRGKVSPFDGHGKLPWKLEWVAKWHTLGITIEGAGKDHCTKGGSRDIASAVLKALFKKPPPRNIPYEFFLVGGAKMSSSKGVGSSARDMADFLPPEILRYLMIGSDPKKTVNYNNGLQYITKLFNEFDRHRMARTDKADDPSNRMLSLMETSPSSIQYQPVPFQLITTMAQLPHLNLEEEAEKRTEKPFSEIDKKHLKRRIESANYWLSHFASPEDTFTIQKNLPEEAKLFSATQIAFLHLMSEKLSEGGYDSDDAIQSLVFNAARMTPIPQPQAFKAIYTLFLAKEGGPKAGSLISFLDREFVINRLRELPLCWHTFLEESAVDEETVLTWLQDNQKNVESVTLSGEISVVPAVESHATGRGVIVCKVVFKGRVQIFRILASSAKDALLDFSQALVQKVQAIGVQAEAEESVQTRV